MKSTVVMVGFGGIRESATVIQPTRSIAPLRRIEALLAARMSCTPILAAPRWRPLRSAQFHHRPRRRWLRIAVGAAGLPPRTDRLSASAHTTVTPVDPVHP